MTNALALVSDALRDAEEFGHLKSPVLRRRADLLAQSSRMLRKLMWHIGPQSTARAVKAPNTMSCRRRPSCARWLDSQDRSVEAQTLLAEIYGWFTEGFDTADLKDVKALLDELNG